MPIDPELDAHIRESFSRQGLMRTLGARITELDAGRVVVEIPFSEGVTQQNGYFHAAASAAIADTAGGYAAFSMMSAADDVLAVEFKINLLRPAVGERLTAEATVLKPGRTLTVCQITVRAWEGECATVVAVMTQTNMRMRPERV
jgi:uncharacterized protein (TIGR00369 family)